MVLLGIDSNNVLTNNRKICSCCGFVFCDNSNKWLKQRNEIFQNKNIQVKTNIIVKTEQRNISKEKQKEPIKYSDEREMVKLDLFDFHNTVKYISKVADRNAEIYLLECNYSKENKSSSECSGRMILLNINELKKSFRYFSSLADKGSSLYLIKSYKGKSSASKYINLAKTKIVNFIKDKMEYQNNK